MSVSTALVLGLAALLVAVARAETNRDPAREALDRLTPLQRAGQVALVAFYVPGTASPNQDRLVDVRALVRDHGIGGFILQKGNNVFANRRGQPLASEIATLTADMQSLSLAADGPGVPLFIAVDHEGDGDPLTHLREGFSALPSAMAIGATYDVASAEAVGRIAGSELSAVGVNMLLGPVLDVLDDPRVDSGGDIGTRSFGGDPYWVQTLGAAYVRGAHHGGRGRLAVVAKHFPGHGGSDRSTDDEVATVNKPLEALRQVELQPFAAVTSGSPGDPDAPHVVDGLMTSHIRYRAVRPDIRSLTPPISFDSEALAALLSLEGMPFSAWRANGGLIVADSLGVRAVRRYFDPAGQSLAHREIARRALLAGNDVLILAQFAASGGWSAQLANVQDTVAYFAEQHRTDATFRRRLDDAALRVLRAKLSLYPSWDPDQVLVEASRAQSDVGRADSAETIATVARSAVTQLRSNERPRAGDRIVVVADYDRATKPRELACPDESCGLPPADAERLSGMAPTLVEAYLLERYGPSGDGSVAAQDIRLVTFCQLRRALAPATPAPDEHAPSAGASSGACDPDAEPADVRRTLAEADWLVFAFAELDPTEVRDLRGLLLPQAQAVAGTGGRAHLAVLSLGPPYYIDQTNFYHLDAHYAALSKIPVSIDAAVAALFGDLTSTGSLPVTYPDADLSLHDQLAPDPEQRLSVRLVAGPDAPTAPARIVVEGGPILDRNGHVVPDGTLVTFATEPPEALGRSAHVTVGTAAGMARVELELLAGDDIQVLASAERLQLEPLRVRLLPPTARPTRQPATATPVAGRAASGPHAVEPTRRLGVGDLLLAAAGLVLLVGVTVAARPLSRRSARTRTRAALLGTCLGLWAYVAYGIALRFAGLGRPFGSTIGVDAVAVVLVGTAIGLLVGSLTARPTGPGPGAGR